MGVVPDTAPLTGTIYMVGESAADPSCFDGSNLGQVIPAPVGPAVPSQSVWLRVADTYVNRWVIGIAAPGIENVAAEIGDAISLYWPITWRNAYWGIGTAELHVRDRARIYVSMNKPDAFRITPTRVECKRSGRCGGFALTLGLSRDYVEATVPVGTSTTVGSWTFTNDVAFEHEEGYVEPPDTERRACSGPSSETLVSAVVLEAAAELSP
jgi:hypothetical protein